jgi:hypothetical protein
MKRATDRISRLSGRHRFEILWGVDVKKFYGENPRISRGGNGGLNVAEGPTEKEGTFQLGGDGGDLTKGYRFIRPGS